jgi:Ni,Fe-hydrogenase III large subunit
MTKDQREDQRQLYETSREYFDMAQRIRDTGILSPEDAADIAHGLGYLHRQLGFYLLSRFAIASEEV